MASRVLGAARQIASIYRVRADESVVEASDDVLHVFVGGPRDCPFCNEYREDPGRVFFSRRIVSTWDDKRGLVHERCRSCNGRWLVAPRT
jgi:hypothetical protein